MKKLIVLEIIVLFIAVGLLLSFWGNSKLSDDNENGKGSGTSAEKYNPPDIKMEEISMGTVFSEGMAFVQINNDEETTYCIDEKGNIVFELNEHIELYMSSETCKFKNGLALLQGQDDDGLSVRIFCDKKGKITYPADVGVSKFYGKALDGGYIIAERVTSSYNASKKEIGVMDTDFQWIVQPSGELYEKMINEEKYGYEPHITDGSYYYKDTLYCSQSGSYLNLKTGELMQEASFVEPASSWRDVSTYFDGNVYLDSNGNVKLNMNDVTNFYKKTAFINDKAVVSFWNKETDSYYFTLIDEKGRFTFEPVMMDYCNNPIGAYDGKETILICENDGVNTRLYSYDITGKQLGKTQTGYSEACVNDGIISTFDYLGDLKHKTSYYKSDLTPLF